MFSFKPLIALLLVAVLPAAALPPAPVAVQRTINESFFGVTVPDPYRYFEDRRDVEAARWMKAHAERAQAALAAIPGRAGLLAAITANEAAADAVAQVTRGAGGLFFSQRRAAGDAQFKLYVRRGASGADRLLLDPQALAPSGGMPALDWWLPSPDGKRVAVGVSASGTEEAVLHVIDVASGRPIGAPMTRANFGGVDWAADSRTLVVNRLQPPRAGVPDTLKYQGSQVWMVHVGEAPSRAKPVFGNAIAGLGLAAADIPFVSLAHDGRWAIGAAVNGTQRELTVFAAPQPALLAGRPVWRRIVEPADGVTAVALFQNTLYLLSHQGAPRSQVWALDLRQADVRRARVVVPQSARVIVNIGAAADALYVEARDGPVKRLFKRAHGETADAVEVLLPVAGSFELAADTVAVSAARTDATDPRAPGALLALQGWATPPRWFAVGADGRVADSGLQPPGAGAASGDIVVTELRVPGHDGSLVPLAILHRRDLPLDGNRPTLLTAYAAYGSTEDAEFSAARQAWLAAGGVFAVANPRGSGADGEDWYRGGFQASKPNSWKDAIACAEYLIAQGYTRPAKLGITGRSAGGIVAGRAMTERPELFAAVVLSVAALDALHWETSANGVPNIPEFGSVATEPGFRALLAMSTYAHIVPGTAYPAVLLTHGVKDPRVEVWESAKTAARLLAATTSGRPILLRLDYDAGHGLGSSAQQRREEQADIYAFLLWQMGVAGYQPPAP